MYNERMKQDAANPAQAELHEFLHAAADREASDVHLVPGHPVTYRIHGCLEVAGRRPLEADEVRQMVMALLPERLLTKLDRQKNFDCSLAVEHKGRPARFRANVFLAQGQWCACLRHVPNDIPTFEWMGFPEALARRWYEEVLNQVLPQSNRCCYRALARPEGATG